MARYRVRLSTDQGHLHAESDEETTLLEAADAVGLQLRQACRNGVCGICRCRLTSGRITYHHRSPHALGGEDRERGYILPCIAFACSDLSLDDFLPQED